MVAAFRVSSFVSSRDDAKRRKCTSTLIPSSACSAVVNLPALFRTRSNQLPGPFQTSVAVEQNGGRKKSENPQDRSIPRLMSSVCRKPHRKHLRRGHSPSEFAPERPPPSRRCSRHLERTIPPSRFLLPEPQ